jgi:hypothetical protein
MARAYLAGGGESASSFASSFFLPRRSLSDFEELELELLELLPIAASGSLRAQRDRTSRNSGPSAPLLS